MKENVFNTLEDLLAEESFRQWIMDEKADQVALWKYWLAQNPDNEDLVEEAMLIVKGIPFEFRNQPNDQAMVLAEWEKLRKRSLKKDHSPDAIPKQQNKRPGPIRIWGLRAAGSIALLVGLGFLLQKYVLNPTVVHQTPFGKQLSLVLPDSTTVELNANSTLTYRTQNPRKVRLNGEAFFHVKKKIATGSNFLVMTKDLTVEVLGTAFNVIEKEYKTEVILEEGVIKLKLNRDFKQEVYLQAGEMLAFSEKASASVEKRQVNPKPLTSWKEGVLTFDDVPLPQVMRRIEEIYGWRTIYHNDKLQTRNINIPIPSDDLETALIMLSKAIGIKIEKVAEDKVLLLY